MMLLVLICYFSYSKETHENFPDVKEGNVLSLKSEFINFSDQIVSIKNEAYKNSAYVFKKCDVHIEHCIFKHIGYFLYNTNSAPITLSKSDLNVTKSSFLLCFGDTGVIRTENSNTTLTNTNFTANQVDTYAGSLYTIYSKIFSEYCYFIDNMAHNIGVLYSYESIVSLRACGILFNNADMTASAINLFSCKTASLKRTYFIKNKIANEQGPVLEANGCPDIYMNVVQFVDNYCISDGSKGPSIKLLNKCKLSMWYCSFDDFANLTIISDSSSTVENQESNIQYDPPRRFADILNNHVNPIRRIVFNLGGYFSMVSYIFIATAAAFIIAIFLALHLYVSPLF